MHAEQKSIARCARWARPDQFRRSTGGPVNRRFWREPDDLREDARIFDAATAPILAARPTCVRKP